MASFMLSSPAISSSSSLSCRPKPSSFFSNPSNVSPPTILFSSRKITTHLVHISSSKSWASRRPIFACIRRSNESELPPESQSNNTNIKEATIDLKLPRRSLSVQFTCNSCGERTKRLVNRLAYERGTVFVQCAGCLKHHKLVDNLNLVVEYDFRNDANFPPLT